MSTLYANWILGLSNFVGLIVFPFLLDWRSYFILSSTMIASLLFHLAESYKHGLAGIPYFMLNILSQELLWIDRICTIIAFFWFVQPYMFQNSYFVYIGIVGLILMGLSEFVFKEKVVTHCLWHFIAYYVVYLTQTMKF